MITVVKFMCVCVYKSMPVMNDNFLSFLHFIISNIISTTTTLVRFFLPGRPVLNELICTGTFYSQWFDEPDPFAAYSYITCFCFLTHLILSIPIARSRRKSAVSKHVNLGDNLTMWIAMFCLIGCFGCLAMVNRTKPDRLEHNSIYLYLLYFVIPTGYTIFVSINHFCKHDSLRKSAVSNLKDLINFH